VATVGAVSGSDACLEDVVVVDADGLGDLLDGREEFNEVFVGQLVHLGGVVCWGKTEN